MNQAEPHRFANERTGSPTAFSDSRQIAFAHMLIPPARHRLHRRTARPDTHLRHRYRYGDSGSTNCDAVKRHVPLSAVRRFRDEAGHTQYGSSSHPVQQRLACLVRDDRFPRMRT